MYPEWCELSTKLNLFNKLIDSYNESIDRQIRERKRARYRQVNTQRELVKFERDIDRKTNHIPEEELAIYYSNLIIENCKHENTEYVKESDKLVFFRCIDCTRLLAMPLKDLG